MFINQDLTWEERQNRRVLNEHCKNAKSKGYNARIRFNKLIVNSDSYNVEDLKSSEPYLLPTGESNGAPATPSRNLHQATPLQLLHLPASLEQDPLLLPICFGETVGNTKLESLPDKKSGSRKLVKNTPPLTREAKKSGKSKGG